MFGPASTFEWTSNWIEVSRDAKPRAGTLWIKHDLGYLPARYKFELLLTTSIRCSVMEEEDGRRGRRYVFGWPSYQKVPIAYEMLLNDGVVGFRLTCSGRAANQQTIYQRKKAERAGRVGERKEMPSDFWLKEENWGTPLPEDKAWRETVWMTQSGKPIRIIDMTGGHVQFAHRAMRKNRAMGINDGKTDKWIELFEMELKERKLDPLECPEELARSKEMLPGVVSDYIQKMGGALGRTPRTPAQVQQQEREFRAQALKRQDDAWDIIKVSDRTWLEQVLGSNVAAKVQKIRDEDDRNREALRAGSKSVKEKLEDVRKQLAGTPIITPSNYRNATAERSRRVDSNTLSPSVISVLGWGDLPDRANPGDLTFIVNTNEVVVYNDNGAWVAVAGREFENRIDPIAKNNYGTVSNAGARLDVDLPRAPKRSKAKKQGPSMVDPSVYGERKIRR